MLKEKLFDNLEFFYLFISVNNINFIFSLRKFNFIIIILFIIINGKS